MAEHHRKPDHLAIHAKHVIGDDGRQVEGLCEVILVSADQENLLDSITQYVYPEFLSFLSLMLVLTGYTFVFSALSIQKGYILDADVMTSDNVVFDRYIDVFWF